MWYWTIFAVLGAWTGFSNNLLHLPPAALLLPVGLTMLGRGAPDYKAAAKRGFFTGSAAALGVLYWIYVPVHVYGGVPLYLALPCPVLLSMFMGLFFAAFVLSVHLFGKDLPTMLLGLFAGGAWACQEALREVVFTGFPWMTLASAFATMPEAVQSAAYVGSLGTGMALVCVALWLAADEDILTRGRVLGLVAAVAFFAFGYVHARVMPPAAGEARVAVVQGNIDQSLKWDDAYQWGTVERYLTLTAGQIQDAGLDLAVWPETAMPFYFQDLAPMSTEVRSFAREHGLALLTGAPAYRLESGDGEYTLFNRAFLVGPGGAVESYYDKEHLLPFGEYMPLKEYLPFGKLVQAVGDFAAGEDQAPLRLDDLALGLLICYESIFPELAQLRVQNGANLLVTISNDAWFGRSSAPWQHLHLSAIRAVEQGRWMVRATNTGVSAFIGPRGRIREATETFKATAATRNVALVEARTFFSHNYNTVRYCLFGMTLLLALVGLAVRRTPGS